MKIINAGYDMEYFDPERDVARIAKAARICYQSPELTTYKQQCDFISRVLMNPELKHPHHSPLEHSSLSVVFTTNRGTSHELVRHRLMSPNQESSRYCRYINQRFTHNVAFIEDFKFKNADDYDEWLDDCADCERRYFRRLERGHSTDEARGVLNNDVKTQIMMTTNYREWRHILDLRSAEDCHYQMREVIVPLLDELARELPCIFGDITY